MKTTSKKSFDKASSMSLGGKKKYGLLKKLPIQFITPINCGGKPDAKDFDPLTDEIYSPFRYNNTSQLLSGKVRRDEIFRNSCMLKQRSIIDLSDLCMVSKIHIKGLPGATQYNLYLSEYPHDSYQRVAVKETASYHQNLRIIDVGSLPARFLMFEVTKGEPLPNDESAVEVYGIVHRQMGNILGQDDTKILFDKTFEIIYGFNK